MRAGAWLAAALLASVGAAYSVSELGDDGKAGLWEERTYSNMELFIAHDPSKTSNDRQKMLSAQLLNGPGGLRHICGTQLQAQHPLLMIGAGAGCKPSGETIAGNTVRFDLACRGGKGFHTEIAFESAVHRTVTLTDSAPSPGEVPYVSKHDLRWISAGCGDLKPGEMRELVKPPYLRRPSP